LDWSELSMFLLLISWPIYSLKLLVMMFSMLFFPR